MINKELMDATNCDNPKLSPKLKKGDLVLIIRGVQMKRTATVVDVQYTNSVVLDVAPHGINRRIWKTRDTVTLLGRATCQ